MKAPRLNLLPAIADSIVEAPIVMETFQYQYGSEMDEHGDREVVDVQNDYHINLKVPRISFLDWIETLCRLKQNGVSSEHMYTSEIVPYRPLESTIWGYFDSVKGNLLTNYDKVWMYIYFIEDFNRFVILRLHSHHFIVDYLPTKS